MGLFTLLSLSSSPLICSIILLHICVSLHPHRHILSSLHLFLVICLLYFPHSDPSLTLSLSPVCLCSNDYLQTSHESNPSPPSLCHFSAAALCVFVYICVHEIPRIVMACVSCALQKKKEKNAFIAHGRANLILSQCDRGREEQNIRDGKD